MSWIILIASGLMETIWVAAMHDATTRPRLAPILVLCAAMPLSLAGLAWAMRSIPVGTAYSVWVGIGAIGAASYGIAALGEPSSIMRIACLLLILVGVAGLKFT